MFNIQVNKQYLIDPEPIFTAWQAVVMLLVIFIVSSLFVTIFMNLLNVHLISFIVEIGMYCLPVIGAVMALNYPFGDILRWRSFLRIDLNLITVFSSVFLVFLSAKIMEIMQKFLPYSEKQLAWKKSLLLGDGETSFMIIFLSVAVIPAFCEEILFRGVIQPAIIKKLNPAVGIAVTAVLFALMHARPQEAFPLFLLGIFLGILAFRGGTFLYAALAHLIFNGAAVIAVSLSKTEGVQMQNGGISVSMIIILCAIFALSMILYFCLTPKRRIGEPDMYYI